MIIFRAKVPHVFVLQITRGPAFKNNSTEHQMLINISTFFYIMLYIYIYTLVLHPFFSFFLLMPLLFFFFDHVHVYPPLILENTLPFAIQFSDPNNQIVINLDSGEAVPVYRNSLSPLLTPHPSLLLRPLSSPLPLPPVFLSISLKVSDTGCSQRRA